MDRTRVKRIFRKRMSPPIFVVLALALVFGGLGSLLMIVAAATDYWETTNWDSDKLSKITGLNQSASYIDDKNGFYKVVLSSTNDKDVETTTTFFLRSNYGGIWRICDTISENFHSSEVFQEAASKIRTFDSTLYKTCIYYITQMAELRDHLDETGRDLERMQNSAASCTIVSILCLLTAAIIGAISVWQKQVSACMVTGVMYVVSGVFACFSLVIITTKVTYMQNDCYSIDPGIVNNREICDSRVIGVGWSVPIAWVAFGCFLVSAIFWCFLSRCLRMEKTKSMI